MEKTNSIRRIALIDEIRGFCVFCMIFNHAFIYWGDSMGLEFGTKLVEFFEPVAPYFSGAFILLCGISCRLSHSNLKRGLILLGIALGISLVTVVILPRIGLEGLEIRFGVLHLLAVCILLFAALDKLQSKLPTLLGVLIFLFLLFLFRNWDTRSVFTLPSIGLWEDLKWTVPRAWTEIHWLYPFGIQYRGFYSTDYFPILPYCFLFGAGTYLGVYVREGKLPEWCYPKRVPFLDWLGTHALIIYLVHMPIILALSEGVYALVKAGKK